MTGMSRARRGVHDPGYLSLIRAVLPTGPLPAPKVIYLSKLGLTEDEREEAWRLVNEYAEACHAKRGKR